MGRDDSNWSDFGLFRGCLDFWNVLLWGLGPHESCYKRPCEEIVKIRWQFKFKRWKTLKSLQSKYE